MQLRALSRRLMTRLHRKPDNCSNNGAKGRQLVSARNSLPPLIVMAQGTQGRGVSVERCGDAPVWPQQCGTHRLVLHAWLSPYGPALRDSSLSACARKPVLPHPLPTWPQSTLPATTLFFLSSRVQQIHIWRVASLQGIRLRGVKDVALRLLVALWQRPDSGDGNGQATAIAAM
jgi:hypothetical protein